MESQYGYYDPDGDADWFPPNPLDSMPLATNSNKYHPSGEPPGWEDTAPSEYEPPMNESDWFIDSIPLNEHPPNSNEYHSPLPTGGEMHEKMYRMATEKGGSWIGGSENQQGGSEKLLNSN